MQDLKERHKRLAIDVAILISGLPRTLINDAYSKQLIRCSSSPGANYRAACRGRSVADFANKLKIVEEELDETKYFLELLAAFNNDKSHAFKSLMNETDELIAITVTSLKKVRGKTKFEQ
jgi:four helix bundle protein